MSDERKKMQTVTFLPPYIKLEQFLKFASAVSTGGEAKNMILSGRVRVNGDVCLLRGKKLHGGETVELEGNSYLCKVLENDS